MGKLFVTLALLVCGFAAGRVEAINQAAASQSDASITANTVIGEVTAIDPASKQVTVKTDAGSIVAVTLEDQTTYMRVPPGETTLTKATKITLAEVSVGDRVLAQGRVAEDRKSVPARRLIVMTKSDIAQKQERERAEWNRRGISGAITALNPETKEITISARGREGSTPVVIAAADEKVRFRRYAPDSVKFSDAKPSTFSEVKVGDQLRALGERSADGTKFTPEEIVTGSFRTIGGTITAIDPQTNEIKLNDIQTRQPLTVVLSKDSALRRIPSEVATMIGGRLVGGGAGGPGGGGPPAGGGGPPQGGTDGARVTRRPAEGAAASGQGGPGGGGRMTGGGMDFQEMLERFPALTISDLKPGDMILVSGTAGAEQSRLTGINLVAGVDPLFKMMQARGGARPSAAQLGSAINMDMTGP